METTCKTCREFKNDKCYCPIWMLPPYHKPPETSADSTCDFHRPKESESNEN